MEIKIEKNLEKATGILVVPFFKEYEKKMPQQYSPELKALVQKSIKSKEFKGKKEEIAYYTVDSKSLPQKVIFIGCGESKKFTHRTARNFGAEVISKAKEFSQQKVAILMTEELKEHTEHLIEGAVLKNYRVSKYKTGKNIEKEEKKDVKEIIIIANKTDKLEEKAKKALIIAKAVNVTKDLVNGPANIVDIDYFAIAAKKLEEKYGYKVTVLDKEKLIKDGWGGLLAVNQGSCKGAKCVILEYYGTDKSKAPIAIAGKGVIFDTGGYNLKPSKYMTDMHCDKAGAATIIGLFTALKDLKIKQNVVGILPLTENMIDGKAMRPSDVITMLNGKTVEVTNTDAEGRLIIADALTYGAKYKPKYLIDVATLTGAVIVALGEKYSGIFCKDKELRRKLIKAGRETDDLLWHLPLHAEFIETLKSKVADLRNSDEETAHFAGGSKGAAFLYHFIEKNKWAHIDIAGTAFVDHPKKYEQRGGTGIGVRLLIKFLECI